MSFGDIFLSFVIIYLQAFVSSGEGVSSISCTEQSLSSSSAIPVTTCLPSSTLKEATLVDASPHVEQENPSTEDGPLSSCSSSLPESAQMVTSVSVSEVKEVRASAVRRLNRSVSPPNEDNRIRTSVVRKIDRSYSPPGRQEMIDDDTEAIGLMEASASAVSVKRASRKSIALKDKASEAAVVSKKESNDLNKYEKFYVPYTDFSPSNVDMSCDKKSMPKPLSKLKGKKKFSRSMPDQLMPTIVVTSPDTPDSSNSKAEKETHIDSTRKTVSGEERWMATYVPAKPGMSAAVFSDTSFASKNVKKSAPPSEGQQFSNVPALVSNASFKTGTDPVSVVASVSSHPVPPGSGKSDGSSQDFDRYKKFYVPFTSDIEKILSSTINTAPILKRKQMMSRSKSLPDGGNLSQYIQYVPFAETDWQRIQASELARKKNPPLSVLAPDSVISDTSTICVTTISEAKVVSCLQVLDATVSRRGCSVLWTSFLCVY